MVFSASSMGHTANVLVVANALIFMMTVILASNPDSSLIPLTVLSPSYQKQGFCIANTDKTVFVQSHFLAFYGDVICVAILWLYLKYYRKSIIASQNSSSNNNNNKSSHNSKLLLADYIQGQFLGIIMHGVAHADYGYHRKPDEELFLTPMETYDTLSGKLSYCGGLLLFWWFILKGITLQISAPSLLMVCVLIQYVFFCYIPGRFGFVFVQTVIYVFAGSTSILYADSDSLFQSDSRLYSAVALARLVNGAMGWIEATQCDTFFKRIGGHVWYDVMIPLSLVGVLVYANCFIYTGNVKGTHGSVKMD